MAKRRSKPNISEHLRLELDHLDAPQIATGSKRRARSETEAGVVLVVDDDPDMRAYVCRCLASLEHEVGEILEASDGTEALSLISNRRINLVVADIVMPQLDGFELRARVHERPDSATTPFLFISGNELDLTTGSENNTYFILKPFNSRSICELVSKILSSHPTIHHHKPSKKQ